MKVKNVVMEFRSVPAASKWIRETLLIAKKDLIIERATGEITTTSGFFALLLTVVASLGASFGTESEKLSIAPEVVWLSVAFASVLGLSRSWYREREEGALFGVVVSPVARSAIFAGKALGMLLFVGIIEVVVVVAAAVLLGIDLFGYIKALAIIGLLCAVGVSATGTLFGAMIVRTRGRDLLLASILFPLLVPTLGTAIVATRDLFFGTPLSELGDYLELLLIFDVVFTAGGLGLFGLLIEG